MPAFLLSIIITCLLPFLSPIQRHLYGPLALFSLFILMSVAILNYIIIGQYLLAVVFRISRSTATSLVWVPGSLSCYPYSLLLLRVLAGA